MKNNDYKCTYEITFDRISRIHIHPRVDDEFKDHINRFPVQMSTVTLFAKDILEAEELAWKSTNLDPNEYDICKIEKVGGYITI